MKKFEICLEDLSEFLETKSGQDFLSELAKSEDTIVLQQVAECPQASTAMLGDMLNRIIIVKNVKWDCDWDKYRTLTSIANNAAADAIILDCLCDFALNEIKFYGYGSRAYDALLNALRAIGRNPNAAEATLIKLLGNYTCVKTAVVENIAISDELLIQIVENHTDTDVRAAAAKQLAQRFKALRQAQTT
ncbi:MAG: hypothetical protein IJ272_01600 [Clostridia bacterium]|nr:hypothetical protein [Clostridia bacterium]